MSPYLEIAANAERELQEALDELAGVKAQRDEMKRQLDKAIEENLALRDACDDLPRSG